MAKRRAKPMVRTAGSRSSPARSTTGAGALRARAAGDGALANEGHHAALAAAVGFPQFAGGDVGGLPPDFGIVMALAPVGLQVLIVEVGQVAVDPGGQVDAVGDGGDRDFPDRAGWATGIPTFPARPGGAGG